MNEKKMWAVYNDSDNMVWIESRNKKTNKIIETTPMCTCKITDVGHLLEKVKDMAKEEERDTFYIVSGTFIPEEKL